MIDLVSKADCKSFAVSLFHFQTFWVEDGNCGGDPEGRKKQHQRQNFNLPGMPARKSFINPKGLS